MCHLSSQTPGYLHVQIMFQVTRDAVHILASEVDLFEGSDLIDPCKDLYLEVVMLRIKV